MVCGTRTISTLIPRTLLLVLINLFVSFVNITHYKTPDVTKVTIIKGALDFNKKNTRDIMTPIKTVYALSDSTLLNEETMAEVRYAHITVLRSNSVLCT